MKNSVVFLEIAKTDLKAAKCLYKQTLYPQAVFSVQQAVEKMTKAFGSLSADMSLDIMKKEVGHKPFNVFLYTLQQFVQSYKSQNEGIPTGSVIDDLQHDKMNFESGVQQAVQVYKLLEKIDGLSSFVLAEQLQSVLRQIRDTSGKQFDPDTDTFMDSVEQFLKKQYKSNDKEKIEYVCALLRKYMHDILLAIGPLAFLVLILPSQCIQNTRYPLDEINPLIFYTKEHPLIKSFDDIIEICYFVYEHMEDIFNMFSEFEKMEKLV